jgi:hypothetical protein
LVVAELMEASIGEISLFGPFKEESWSLNERREVSGDLVVSNIVLLQNGTIFDLTYLLLRFENVRFLVVVGIVNQVFDVHLVLDELAHVLDLLVHRNYLAREVKPETVH